MALGIQFISVLSLPLCKLSNFCDGNIYWTHYRKCFDPDLDDLANVDNYCAKAHLAKEVASLEPKIIIIVGNQAVRKKIKGFIQSTRALVIEKPFPDGKNTTEFADVRKIIAPHLKYVKIDLSGSTRSASEGIDEQKIKPRGLPVSLNFELNALEIAFGWRETAISDRSIEGLWYRNIVVPNLQRCAKLVSVYSFMESQIEVLQEVRSSSHSSGPGAREIAAGTTGSRLITAGQRLGASGSQKDAGNNGIRHWAEHVKENHAELLARLIGWPGT